MTTQHFFARRNPDESILLLHDMWTFGNKLDVGDVDDSVNVFKLARMCRRLHVYIVNDTGDQRRYKGFMEKYYAMLKEICPTICILHSESEFPLVDKVVICAPLHATFDKRMVDYIRTYTPHRLLYGQGDTPRAYNMSTSALCPYISFDENPTLLTVNEHGENYSVPITLYNTNATNRKLTVSMLSDMTCPELTKEVLAYAKHKLCFLPEKPFAVGLLLKKYGTGNTAYGLCHAKHLLELEDLSDPDLVLNAYFMGISGNGDQKSTNSYVYKLICKYPTVHDYYIHMCGMNPEKLSSPEDQMAFQRALAMVVVCTVEWFGERALQDRFRTLADDDVLATVDGTELYSPSMFDLIVGISAVYNLTPKELSMLLHGGPNQLISGPFVELLNVKLKKD